MAVPLRLALLLIAVAAGHCEHYRRLLMRPMPEGSATLSCRNTLLGPLMYADDRGMLCKDTELNHMTGCCDKGERHSCQTCDDRDRCCEGYEACVSCCLAPGNGAKQRLPEVPKIPGKKDSGTWGDEFELCAAVCRTHSRSTSHENSYISPRHHCFSKLGKPLLSPPLPPDALAGVLVVMGAPGVSCDATCERSSRSCSPRHLPLLDSCDGLRESVACEAGCLQEPRSPVMPFYADGDAPKADRPALCVASASGGGAAKEGGSGSYSCQASQQHMRRLCPCVSGRAAESESASAAAGGGRAGARVPAAAGSEVGEAGGGERPAAVMRARQGDLGQEQQEGEQAA